MAKRNFNPHRVTPQERRVFVLSGDKPVKSIKINRRRKLGGGKTNHQLIAFVQDRKPITDLKSIWPQYYKDQREKVIGIE